jgi:hypothetical protein
MNNSYQYVDPDNVYTDPQTKVLRNLAEISDAKTLQFFESAAVIANWIRNRNTPEYLGIWEILYNPGFKPLEFEEFRKKAGLNAFTLSPQKWVESTNAIEFICKNRALRRNVCPQRYCL